MNYLESMGKIIKAGKEKSSVVDSYVKETYRNKYV